MKRPPLAPVLALFGEDGTMAGVSVSRVSQIQREIEDGTTDGSRPEASAGVKQRNDPFRAQFMPYPNSAAIEGYMDESAARGDLIRNMYDLIQLNVDGGLYPFASEVLEREQPDVAIHDSLASSGKLAAKSASLPTVAFITTFVLTPRTPGIPFRAFADSVRKFCRVYPRSALLALDMKRRYGTFPVGLLSAGMCTGTLNVVFTSRALQPGGSRIGDDYVFVGPTAENRRDPMELPPQDLEHSPLVYISLGTLARNPAFFLTCFDAFSREPGRFVLSIGKQTDISGLGDIPDNFLVRRSVPQLQILKHADAFITHGGLNSVQESLIQGVPMIAIPQQLEQAAVALQMARHGAGIALRTSPPYAVVSAQELRLALRSILSNPAYAAAARRLGSSLAESGGSASAVRHVLEFSRRAVTESAAHPG